MSLYNLFFCFVSILGVMFLLLLYEYAPKNGTIKKHYYEYAKGLHQFILKNHSKNNFLQDLPIEVVYKEMDKNIHFENPAKDLVFVLAKAAADPPKVEVNNSCLPKPLVPSAQLTCEGEHVMMDRFLTFNLDQGLKNYTIEIPRKIAIMYMLGYVFFESEK